MYTLDTNVVIYYLKGEPAVTTFLERIAARETALYVASVTEVELFGFSKLTEKEEEGIELFLETISVIPLDSQIARIAGSLRRRYALKVPDSIIGGTALFTGSTLVTRNIRDFERVPQLTIERI